MPHLVSPLYASALFQRIAGGTWRPGGTELTRHGLDLCAFAQGSKILDVGCGQGASLAVLRNRGLNGTGLDKECSLVEPFPFVRADAQDPPFADGSFDGILCECVLSLLPDAERALRRFAAVLRPGGKLFTFSCSGAMKDELFGKVVDSAACDAKADFRITGFLGQGPDHPVSAAFPEGRYLKGITGIRL